MSRPRGASIGGRTVGTPATRVKRQTRTIEPFTLAPSLSCGITSTDGINYVETAPDSAGLSVTGDIDIRALMTLNDWSPASEIQIINKRSGPSFQGYGFRIIGGGGTPSFEWEDSGGSSHSATATDDFGTIDLDNGSTHWVRVTLDVNNGAGGRDANFYLSDDGVTWTPVGSTVTQAGTTSIKDTTDDVWIGSNLDSPGVFSYLEIRNGIGGTIVASPDFRDHALDTVSFVDDQSNTWTITAYGEWVEC